MTPSFSSTEPTRLISCKVDLGTVGYSAHLLRFRRWRILLRRSVLHATRKSGFTASSFTATLVGLTSSSTICSTSRSPNTRNSRGRRRICIIMTRTGSTRARARVARVCISPRAGRRTRPGFHSWKRPTPSCTGTMPRLMAGLRPTLSRTSLGTFADVVILVAYKSALIVPSGVSTICHVHDILDIDQFWEEELSKVNQDRLFGCYIYKMAGGDDDITVNGLFAGHAYSVISAIEVNGKRFLRVRNPWGKTEWTGAWSDGSKEWTPEWLALLPDLGHKFGNDGEFLMEYSDFLKTWTMIERSKLFDSGWKMSSMWLNVNSRSFPCAWNYGDVSFTFSVTEDAPAVIVLSQLDDRYFSEISGYSQWTLEFVIYRKDAPASEPYATSSHTIFWRRSVNIELDKLEAGDYVVHVRLDRRHIRNRSYFQDAISGWDHRKLSKVWTEACISSSIAVNFDPNAYGDLLPADVDTYGGQDLTAIELAYHEDGQKKPVLEVIAAPQAMLATHEPAPKDGSASGSEVVVNPEQSPMPPSIPIPVLDSLTVPDSPVAIEGQTVEIEAQTAEIVNPNAGDDDNKSEKFEDAKSETAEVEVVPDDGKSDKASDGGVPPPNPDLAGPGGAPVGPMAVVHEGWRCDGCAADPIVGPRYHCLDAGCPDYDLCSDCMSKGVHNSSHRMLCVRNPADANKLRDDVAEGEDNSVTLGLRVYTKGGSAASVDGQLRHGKVVAWKKKSMA
ncbi:hypothetical protein FS749_002148 [Ceratobasidium sp. UAMH 11750]|nr:hypothetical protein FS749_002148 [Ceratobasidium sp. UAMH 11750]